MKYGILRESNGYIVFELIFNRYFMSVFRHKLFFKKADIIGVKCPKILETMKKTCSDSGMEPDQY